MSYRDSPTESPTQQHPRAPHSKLIDAPLLIHLITVITWSQTKPFLMKINGNSFAQCVCVRVDALGAILAYWQNGIARNYFC